MYVGTLLQFLVLCPTEPIWIDVKGHGAIGTRVLVQGLLSVRFRGFLSTRILITFGKAWWELAQVNVVWPSPSNYKLAFLFCRDLDDELILGRASTVFTVWAVVLANAIAMIPWPVRGPGGKLQIFEMLRSLDVGDRSTVWLMAAFGPLSDSDVIVRFLWVSRCLPKKHFFIIRFSSCLEFNADEALIITDAWTSIRCRVHHCRTWILFVRRPCIIQVGPYRMLWVGLLSSGAHSISILLILINVLVVSNTDKALIITDACASIRWRVRR